MCNCNLHKLQEISMSIARRLEFSIIARAVVT